MRTYDSIPSLQQDTSVALGLFDGLHRGHQQVISKAVSFGNGLTPSVFSFDYDNPDLVTKPDFKNLLSPTLKVRLLQTLGTEIFIHPPFSSIRDLTASCFLEEILFHSLRAKAIFCGYDYRFGRNAEGDAQMLQKFCASHGIYCEVVPALTENGAPISSTRIRDCIHKGEMECAQNMLGYPYTIDFPVSQGHKLGRRLGFPTINQPYPEGNILPRFGVYAAIAEIDGKSYMGVTNIGVKPTVGSDNAPAAETYVIGYEGDLYGKQVPLSLIRFVRPEQQFGSVEELKQQIARDTDEVIRILQENRFNKECPLVIQARQER